MDAKITLSFNQDVIIAAKAYAEKHHISLSRLTEFIFQKMTDSHAYSIEDLPVSDWVNLVSEGEATYTRTNASRKSQKNEFFEKKK